MKIHSRRTFLNNIWVGSVGLGIMAPFSSCMEHGGEIKSTRVNLPVIDEVDICILGGSCTGVFAGVRAARLGASVAIVEKQNAFGGVATSSLVNIWHSLYDTEGKQQIIAGLTKEVLDRLATRDAVNVSSNPSSAYTFNSQELKIELDELVLETGIHPYLHTLFSEPCLDEDGQLIGVIVDNKSGRGIIKAKYFIDATGDGDLCYRLGLKSYVFDLLQPPTTCACFEGWNSREFDKLLKMHAAEFNIPDGFVWGATLPNTNVYMLAGTRVYKADCSVADDLTKAEIEGRRQIRAIMDMLRKYGTKENLPGLVALPSYIGIRETRHIKCLYQISDEDAMYGKHFEDAIANGSYRLDIHHQDKPGLTFRYLDGSEVYVRPGVADQKSRWRKEMEVDPTFYQIPLRSIIPEKHENLMVAGRMLDAAIIAYSGIRVMVNMNQVGEAAGVTSYLALHRQKRIRDVSSGDVRDELKKGGSIII
ncbi:FAD-dependent oxidoreductase [Parabacteroides faecis]|uniref:FAD-dependent oxidoreductase n=1 Tax=Parabacteroides TaxID=375288 RepID=UPI000EFDDCD4|nr:MULTISPECIES: FAD-dependent oxidoreductase [Parabacteroides]MBC8620577.1 FAD-dependent oxidoreductase [Parabacteroides faecis]RHR93569.1 FAD-dependent oxidoreductase [Parabacteroides sp. AF14-59]